MHTVEKQFNLELRSFLLVCIGAVPGSYLRFQLDNQFMVNIFGTFILGLLFGMRVRLRIKLLLGVGFCGSLTTFSGWIFNSFNLIINGFLSQAILLIFTMCLSGFISFVFGFYIGQTLKKLKLSQ